MPCCYSTEVMGNARETPFDAIWRGAKHAAFRERLMKGRFAKHCIDNRCALAEVLHH